MPAVIAGYARSPFTPAKKGELARTRPDDIAATVINGLIKETGVDPMTIEDLIVGTAFPEAEQGFNVARMITFLTDTKTPLLAEQKKKILNSITKQWKFKI